MQELLAPSSLQNLSSIVTLERLSNLPNIGISVAVILVLFALKAYFNGAAYEVPKGTSLVGKYAIVTGGNSGIGAYTVRQLASLGCQVVIGARDRQTAEAVIKDIKKSHPQSSVDFVQLDLSDRESIKAFAGSISYPKIDFLVNNAGIMNIAIRRLTKQGVEMQWGVNHLGHFYLTYLLWNKISKSQSFRVINVSSLAHKRPAMSKTTLDFDNINFQNNYNPVVSYGRSKLYNVLFTRALAEKIKTGKGLTASLHPGVVRTQLLRETIATKIVGQIFNYVLKIVWPVYWFFTKSSQQGSYTTLFTLLSPEVENGCYYSDCKKSDQNPLVTKQNWDRLWEISQRTLGIKFEV